MRGFILALLVVLGGAAAARGQVGHRVDLPLDAREWQPLSSTREPGVSIQEYVPVGESGETWTRFVSIQLFAVSSVDFPGASEMLGLCRQILVARCPGAQWRQLEGGDRVATYEWRITGCDGEPDQHELGRVIRRGDVWARITFSVRDAMDDRTRDEWLGRLRGARIVEDAP
jgi:hypothetical protein